MSDGELVPEHGNIEMRNRGDANRKRSWVVVVASLVGLLAIVVGAGALIVGTFPRPLGPATSVVDTQSVGASPNSGSGNATSEAPVTVVSATTTSAPNTASAAEPRKKGARQPAAPPALPLGMAKVLPGSQQLIVATGPALGATHGTLRIFNLQGNAWKQVFSATCRFGTYGLIDGAERKQDSRTTPTGIWWPGTFVWGWHASAPSGTKMPYRQTTDSIWWSEESGPTYNSWVDSTRHVSGEHLIDGKIQYEYALSTGYNAKPNDVVEGRGTAIFLHVFDPPDYHNGLSAGCVTVSRSDMIRVFQTLEPALKPCFAVGTNTPGTPTSIASF